MSIGQSTSVKPVYDTRTIRSQAAYELRELFRYRFLIQNLVARDLKIRYKRSTLGFIWVMLNPLLTMTITTYIFSQILKIKMYHFPTYALVGLLLFNLFSQGTIAAMSQLTSNASILSRMYIPPSVFVLSAVSSAMVNFLYALAPLALIAILIDHILPGLIWLLAIIPVIEMAFFTFGLALILSAMMIYFHDIFEIFTVIISLLGYATPLFYPLSILSPQLQRIEMFNPIFVFINSMRTLLIQGQVPSFHEMALGFVFATVAMAIGWIIFTRLERDFAYQF